MTRNEIILYLFNEDLIQRFRNNFETLTAYGIVGYNNPNEVLYTDILKEVKNVVEWYVKGANKEDVINWTPFFYKIIGIKDTNKFISAMLDFDVNMGWVA